MGGGGHLFLLKHCYIYKYLFSPLMASILQKESWQNIASALFALKSGMSVINNKDKIKQMPLKLLKDLSVLQRKKSLVVLLG